MQATITNMVDNIAWSPQVNGDNGCGFHGAIKRSLDEINGSSSRQITNKNNNDRCEKDLEKLSQDKKIATTLLSQLIVTFGASILLAPMVSIRTRQTCLCILLHLLLFAINSKVYAFTGK